MGDRQYCPNHPPRWCCPHRAPLTSAHRACQPFSRPKGGAISRHLASSRWYQHGFSDPKKYRLRRKPVPEKNTACGAHATTPHPGCHACCGELLDFMILFRIASPYAYAYAWTLHRYRCQIGACHPFLKSVVENSSRRACSEKNSAVQGKIAAPREKILATLGERSKRHFPRPNPKK